VSAWPEKFFLSWVFLLPQSKKVVKFLDKNNHTWCKHLYDDDEMLILMKYLQFMFENFLERDLYKELQAERTNLYHSFICVFLWFLHPNSYSCIAKSCNTKNEAVEEPDKLQQGMQTRESIGLLLRLYDKSLNARLFSKVFSL